MPSSRQRLYCTALLVEVLLFHRRVLFSGYQFPWDFRAVHLPLATFVADSFRRGELPLWDPYTYCGNPIFANIQTALFYPPVLVATLASVWLGPAMLPWLLGAVMVVQIFFAGVCTFALLRRLGVSPEGAWIAGSMYELGCFFASQAEHMGAIHGASWLPLAWLCVIELASAFRWRWLAILSLSLSMTVLAGLPQVAVAAFGSTLCLAIVLAPRILPFRVLAAWLWALLLAAVQLIPTIELTGNSVAKYRAEWLHNGGGIKLGALFSLIVPDYWNVFDLAKFHGPSDPTFLYLYSSIAGLALAVGAMFWKPDQWTRAFAVLTLAATIWMLGDSTPVGRTIFMALPVTIRIGIHPEFTLCVFALGLAVLAGFGTDRILRSPRLQILAGVVIVCDLVLVSSGRPMNAAPPTAPPTELIATLRRLTGSTNPPSRFDTTAGVSYEWSSTAPLIGIPTANGCDPLALERVIQARLSFSPGERWGTCYQVVDTSSPVLRLMNDRYLLSQSADGYKIDEVRDALPRFFFVNRAEHLSDLVEGAKLLHLNSFSPKEKVIIESPVEAFDPVSGTVEVVSYAPSSIILKTHTANASFLVAADSYYPGWQATIDGQPTPLYVADVAFRGIRIPAGDHRIQMRFVPRYLLSASIVSAVSLLFAIYQTFRRTNYGPLRAMVR